MVNTIIPPSFLEIRQVELPTYSTILHQSNPLEINMKYLGRRVVGGRVVGVYLGLRKGVLLAAAFVRGRRLPGYLKGLVTV